MQTKTYLLVSPQPWGKMYLSKHNYAIELAEAGNKVFFLNPPTYKKKPGRFNISSKEILPNLTLVDYELASAIHMLRFKARPLYDFIIHHSFLKQLNKLASFDEIWCFDPNAFSDFKALHPKKKLLFIVDQHDNPTLKKLADDADGIATISSLIMDYFQFSDKPKLLLNHGLNKTFTALAKDRLLNGLKYDLGHPLKVAYVGNLLQGNRMDYKTIQTIVEQNPEASFHFYGPYEETGNTLGSNTSEGLKAFIGFLKNNPRVHLHGVLPQSQLALEMQDMDAFLTCYNYMTDYNKSSNCHKIIEYLSTGKACISNRIIMYEKTSGLLEMPDEYTNENLPSLFRNVITNIAEFNNPERQKKRIEFALENTYRKNIDTIERFHNSGRVS
ncbi:glycosyltransferase family 4 protein [Flavisolibacter ginsenosidimutans]|uniref:Glycosyltransferase family 4 protein n=1 Tax=Flavisolibacter ginsenosidimutans TaxID=661481 RepID=A0A5B8UEP3_9BACT|nr:glycosyltransferase family 4 protein [Flavisolibacter ginsenosidimutans]QEC54892.1 glycosyltransferase family 4 protein [Flavisolibacter ginsenosidimutans]